MELEIPVVFFHIGSHEYFKSAVDVALRQNKVIHIGDQPITQRANYKFVDFREVSDKFDDFSKVYLHMSYNPQNYELVCFLRWIALMNLMKRENIQVAYYSDSDVANIDNMTVTFKEIGSPDVSYVIVDNDSEYRWSACGLSSYWNLETITDMVDFMFNCYRNEKLRNKLEEKFKWHINSKSPGGVCDMTVFYLYSRERNVLPLNKQINGAAFEQNINDSENFVRNEYKMNDGMKLLQLNDGNFFGTTNDGKKVRFRTLHCQGNAKKIMFEIQRLTENVSN